jgi:YHS domain-containing protein
MKNDLVCGRSVNEGTEFTATHGDRLFYFCSEVCRDAFVGNPLAYIDRSGAVSSTEGSPKILDEGVEVPSRT